MKRVRFALHPDGTVRFIHDDEITAMLKDHMATSKTIRVSDVETNAQDEWVADMNRVAPGVTSPPFPLDQRAAALAWERDYVDAHVLTRAK